MIALEYSENHQLKNQIATLKTEIASLKEQLAWFQRQLFGKKSEKIIPPHAEQLLIEGCENLVGANGKEETITVPPHERTKRKNTEEDKIQLSPDLPVEAVVLDIPEHEKICQETGKPLVKIGEEITDKLAHRPGSFFIKRIIRPKYALASQEEKGIITAELPDCILPKCRADESFLAEVLSMKFADHLPLNRISEIHARSGVRISRKLLSQWVIRCGLALTPLYDVMLEKVLQSGNIFVDESPIDMQEKGACKTTYMWVIAGGESSNPPYRVYDFREDRCHDNVIDILQGYNKVMHSDKYGAYEKLAQSKQIVWCPCWAHIRRKFFESNTDPTFRSWVLRKIRYLFMLEKVAWQRLPAERLRIRQEKEGPIIDELIQKIQEKLSSGEVLPKSKLRQALGYFTGLVPYLKNYTQYPFARLDNNVAERAIRPLTVGRKNWLFFGSPKGGKAAAVILSLVQTCRALKINPREYLEDVMKRLMGHSSQKLAELLPDAWAQAKQNPPLPHSPDHSQMG